MSKRFFSVSLIVIGLICSGFSFVANPAEITSSKPIVVLKDYNSYPEITQTGFVFHMLLEVEKDSKEFSTNDFTGYVGQKTMDSLDYSVSKKIVSEDKNILLFDYEIRTPFFVGGFDFVPSIKGFSYPEYGWFHSGWSGKLRIDLDHTQVPSTLINFPVLINISSLECIYDYVQADGDDLFFTTDDDCFKYNHELECFSAGSGVVNIVAWVNITSLSSSVDTSIWMYYGNATCDSQENVEGTWDSDYIGVWHMDESSATIDDSTGSFDGTKKASAEPAQGTGSVGYGQVFDGTDDYVDMGYDSGLRVTTMTIEAWAESDDWDSQSQQLATKDDEWYFQIKDIRSYKIDYEPHAGGRAITPSALSDNTWYNLVGIYDGSNSLLYVDGNLVDTTVGSAPLQDGHNFIIGAHGNGINGGTPNSDFWDGTIDEVRYSKIERSADYITVSYNYVNNASTACANPFITLYDCCTNSLPVASNPVPANHSVDVSVALANWCVNISDDWTNFNVTIQIEGDMDCSYNNQTNGTFCCSPLNMQCEMNKTVWVNVTEWNWCTSDEGRTAYYWYWFITENCEEEPEISVNMSFTALLGDIDTCPCCISLCFNISSDNGFANVTLNSNYTGSWMPMQSFDDLANGTYCFVIYNWTRYNYTYYFNYSFDNGVNFSDSTTYYIETVNLSDCNNILGDTMEINIEISQLVMLILLGCWLFFTYLFYTQRQKEKILAWVQFAFTMPLSFIIAGVVAPYSMGYAVAVTIPLLSLIILVDAYYGK